MSSLETPTITQCLGGTFLVPPFFCRSGEFRGLTWKSGLLRRRLAIPR